MTVNEFASQLADTAPSISDLTKLGLSIEGAESLIRGTLIAPRLYPLALAFTTKDKEDSDALLRLISLYDVSELEIGIISFLEAPADFGSYLQFAKVELDPVLLHRSGEINVMDWQRPGHCMWKCAINSSLFLEALVMTNRFLTLTMLYDDINNDEAYALEIASAIADVAGGKDYLSLYQMLLGV